MKTIEQLYSEAKENAQLISEYRSAAENGTVEDFLRAHDCGASAQEAEEFAAGLEKRGELSDDELDNVAAGGICGGSDEYFNGYRVVYTCDKCKHFKCRYCGNGSRKKTFLDADICAGERCKTAVRCDKCAYGTFLAQKFICKHG